MKPIRNSEKIERSMFICYFSIKPAGFQASGPPAAEHLTPPNSYKPIVGLTSVRIDKNNHDCWPLTA
jgi:hypothetical protein